MKLIIPIIVQTKSEKVSFLYSTEASSFSSSSSSVIIIRAADTHHCLIVSRQTGTNDKLYRYTYGVEILVQVHVDSICTCRNHHHW